jgi:hypothetical protein
VCEHGRSGERRTNVANYRAGRFICRQEKLWRMQLSESACSRWEIESNKFFWLILWKKLRLTWKHPAWRLHLEDILLQDESGWAKDVYRKLWSTVITIRFNLVSRLDIARRNPIEEDERGH